MPSHRFIAIALIGAGTALSEVVSPPLQVACQDLPACLDRSDARSESLDATNLRKQLSPHTGRYRAQALVVLTEAPPGHIIPVLQR